MKKSISRRQALRRAHERKLRRMRFGIITILTAVLLITVLSVTLVKADEKKHSEPDVYYTSITIEKNDTLWSIAREYAPENQSIKSYINELQELNNLNSSNITQGMHLIVCVKNAN